MDTPQILQGIAKVVKDRRKELGHTAKVVASQANLSPRFYAQIEKGEANISITRLLDVSQALDMGLTELISKAQKSRPCIALLGIRGAGKSSVGPESRVVCQYRLAIRREHPRCVGCTPGLVSTHRTP